MKKSFSSSHGGLAWQHYCQGKRRGISHSWPTLSNMTDTNEQFLNKKFAANGEDFPEERLISGTLSSKVLTVCAVLNAASVTSHRSASGLSA